MKISMWKTMGLNPSTTISYCIIIDPMINGVIKHEFITDSKWKMYWFVIKQFTKHYRVFLKTDKEFIAQSELSAAKLKSQGIEANFVKKPHYRKKYKNNSK